MRSVPHQNFIDKGPVWGEETSPRYYSVLVMLDVAARMAEGRMFVSKESGDAMDAKAQTEKTLADLLDSGSWTGPKP
jgi:hypothetical protein